MRTRTSAWWLATVGILLVATACSGSAEERSSTATAQPTTVSTPTPASTSTPTSSPTPVNTVGPDVAALKAGPHAAKILGSGSYPDLTVVVPDGWYDRYNDGHFIVKYPTDQPGPVLGISAWDVGRVYRDPCHWQGQDYDPGPTVDDLVKALTAQPLRSATRPTPVTLAGYSGQYLEWSVPADMKSSTWTDFDACDVEPSDGHRNFESWLGKGGVGNRYQQVPGQVDRLWILDVDGQRLVVDATYSPDTSKADRAEQEQVVESLRFAAP